ncbi:phospholipase effector Tle1 domain-containing protein [Lysobacter enzymogenes]|uniref:phospholipase effector Tle1 domain-containing protein n=1 Tax=Lysobacter enzymogenes TaxID=69 RepID=UPI001A97CC20|nr:DUF2235 domain-containing protein [Lysobacter enzymogenes]QQP97374.1 DUF2235 domain-containing protein [Lysobacter enzymogenes]
MGGGKNPDGVKTYPADRHDLDSYVEAAQALSQLQAPKLLDSRDPHSRLFVACFDGTGNSMYGTDPKNHTNVAEVAKQLQNGLRDDIAVGYVEGPGTQKNALTRGLDAATGKSFDPRLEKMYAQFIEQAKAWKAEDPDAKIRVAGIGYSRGAEQEAAFSRLVDERGIQDPAGAVYVKDKAGNIVAPPTYRNAPLQDPAQEKVPQAVGLFDPVGTGEPRKHDRRLPPSVMSAFQITAEDERRDLFKSTSIVREGHSENQRFLNVTVGGAHSNIGGSYELNGLSIRSGNLMVDYLNSLSDQPYLQKRAEPTDPKLNVVHRSDQPLFYTTFGFRDGERDRIETVASKDQVRRHLVADPNHKEPIDEAMSARFERNPVRIGPTPGGETGIVAGGRSQDSDIDRTFARLVEAARNGDTGAFRDATREHAQNPQTQERFQAGLERYQQLNPPTPQLPAQPETQRQPPPQADGPSPQRAPGL